MRTREDVFSTRILLDDLENRVRELRLVPLSTLFDRMPRAIYDMAQDQNKRVRVLVTGNAIAVDADVLDKLSEPLVHLLRNCIDHGIESTAERIAANKPEEGTVTLHAMQKGAHVEIIVRDDGRGIDVKKPSKRPSTAVLSAPVKRKALATTPPWLGSQTGFPPRQGDRPLRPRHWPRCRMATSQRHGRHRKFETRVGQGTEFKLIAPVSTVLSRTWSSKPPTVTSPFPANPW